MDMSQDFTDSPRISVSGSMADMRLLLLGGCCRQVSTVVSRVVW